MKEISLAEELKFFSEIETAYYRQVLTAIVSLLDSRIYYRNPIWQIQELGSFEFSLDGKTLLNTNTL